MTDCVCDPSATEHRYLHDLDYKRKQDDGDSGGEGFVWTGGRGVSTS